MTKRIEIKADTMGNGSIVIDGKDISGMVEGANIRIRAGKCTSVFIMLNSDVSVSAECETQNAKLASD